MGGAVCWDTVGGMVQGWWVGLSVGTVLVGWCSVGEVVQGWWVGLSVGTVLDAQCKHSGMFLSDCRWLRMKV